jgi:hypothetical protein
MTTKIKDSLVFFFFYFYNNTFYSAFENDTKKITYINIFLCGVNVSIFLLLDCMALKKLKYVSV